LSHPDWSLMLERQDRYRRSNVRGLWFVKTRKPLPTTRELPVFPLSESWGAGRGKQTYVGLWRADDSIYVWHSGEAIASVELSEFVGCALNRELVWAPYAQKAGSTLCSAVVHIARIASSLACDRDLLGTAERVFMSLSLDRTYTILHWNKDKQE